MAALAALSACRKAADASSAQAGGSTLVIGQVGDILATAPVSNTGNNATWLSSVLESLGSYDATTRTLMPLLATKWVVSDGGRQIAYTVRSGVTWHSGRPFTAQDVAYTFTTLRDNTVLSRPFGQAWLLKAMTDISVKGQDVVVRFRAPVAGALEAVANISILDRESIKKFDQGTAWIGTGPFVVSGHKAGASLSLRRNPSYWNPAHPYLSSVQLQIFSRADALLSALRTGEVQLTMSLAPRDVAALKSNTAMSVTTYPDEGSGIYLGCNVTAPGLTDRRVRQAIAYAVDRKRLATDVFKGQATASCAPWTAQAPSFSTASRDRYEYDPAHAKTLLRQAGYSHQQIIYEVSGAKPVFGNVAQIVQRNLQDVGLNVQLVTLQSAENDERFQKTNFRGLYTAGDGQNSLPAPFLVNGSRPWSNTNNLWHFSAPQFDTLAMAATRAQGAAELHRTGDALTAYMLEQAFCTELVLTSPSVVASKVTGMAFRSGALILTDARA